jgi:hypothetical protein
MQYRSEYGLLERLNFLRRRLCGRTIGVDGVIAVAGALVNRQQHMRQRLPARLRAIERCLKLDDLDGQWCVPADLAKDHVRHFDHQLAMAGDLVAELSAVDAVCQLRLGGDERPRWGRVVAIHDARVAPETKGADFGQPNVLTLRMNDPRMGFVPCLRLGGEKHQADAKRRRRDKFLHRH